jgi:hypothetical protein
VLNEAGPVKSGLALGADLFGLAACEGPCEEAGSSFSSASRAFAFLTSSLQPPLVGLAADLDGIRGMRVSLFSSQFLIPVLHIFFLPPPTGAGEHPPPSVHDV